MEPQIETTSQVNMYTNFRTNANANAVRFGIAQKILPNPYFALEDTVKQVVTDMDHYPYSRFNRNVYYSEDPIVMDREAGYRQPRNEAYKARLLYPPEENPRLCFESACSTVYPCYPSYLRKYADKEQMEVLLNKKCITYSP